MLQTKNILIMAVLAIVGALTVGCTNDDNIIVDENPAASRTVILTTTVGFADTPAETRALDGNGKKTFAEGDRVALIYKNTSGQTVMTQCVDLAVKDIHNSGKRANLTFTLDNPIEGNVILVYPAAMADPDAADGINMNELQAKQDGTLATLSSNFDAATATDNMTVSGTTATLPTSASLTNQLCIGKFTIKDDGSTDITSDVKQLTISDGSHSYIVDRTAAADPIYVAMKPIANTTTISLTAVTSTTPYKKSVTNKALAANKIYPIKVTMEKDDDRATPLTLEAINDGTTRVLFELASGLSVQYSIDGGANWTDYTSGTAISLRKDETVSFRGNNATYTSSSYSNISCSAECYIYGNIMSLISSSGYATATKLTGANTFSYLFHYNSYITNDASKALVLPATTLTGTCYNSMFCGCTSLTTAPVLPATTLTNGCYSNMFYNCTGLTSAPALPATALTESCYSGMFDGCTNLTTAPALPAKTLAKQCYAFMFWNCTNLTPAPALPATTLTERCYDYMFSGCTSLTTAPALPATTLTEGCYSSMFTGCTNLTTAPALPATTLARECYSSMFSGCSNLTTAPVLPATTLTESCYRYMFAVCSNLTTAPVLPAETLANGSYYCMFQYCTKLSSVTCLATDISATDCLTYWLDNAGTDASERKLHVKSGQTGSGWNWNVPATWTVVDDQ